MKRIRRHPGRNTSGLKVNKKGMPASQMPDGVEARAASTAATTFRAHWREWLNDPKTRDKMQVQALDGSTSGTALLREIIARVVPTPTPQPAQPEESKPVQVNATVPTGPNGEASTPTYAKPQSFEVSRDGRGNIVGAVEKDPAVH